MPWILQFFHANGAGIIYFICKLAEDFILNGKTICSLSVVWPVWVEESVRLGRPAEINEDNELKTAAAYFDDAWKKTRKRVQDEKKKTLKAQKEANQLKQDLVDAFNTNQQLQHQLDEAEFRLNCKEEECSKLEEHVKFLQGSKDQLAKQLFDSLKRDCQNCAALKESNNTARNDLAKAINSFAVVGRRQLPKAQRIQTRMGGQRRSALPTSPLAVASFLGLSGRQTTVSRPRIQYCKNSMLPLTPIISMTLTRQTMTAAG